MGESRDRIKQFKRDLIKERLSLCDDRQIAFFHKIFPNGPDENKIEAALDLIDRTIVKNEKRNGPNV